MSNDEVNQEKKNENADYEILGEKYPNFDFSFKITFLFSCLISKAYKIIYKFKI